MTETELPNSIQYLLIALQVLAMVFFVVMAWPYIRKERWREKFIENKTARSIIIVFVLVFLFIFGMTTVFDIYFPMERLDGRG